MVVKAFYGEDNFTLYSCKDDDEESIEPSRVYDNTERITKLTELSLHKLS